MSDAPDNKRKNTRVPVSLLVKVKYEQEGEFAQQFATNISKGGLFLQSRKPYAKGTRLKFELRLKGGQTVLRGIGVVAWTRGPSSKGEKPRIPGMGVKFLKLDAASKAMVDRILSLKAGEKAEQEKNPVPEAPTKTVSVETPASPADPRQALEASFLQGMAGDLADSPSSAPLPPPPKLQPFPDAAPSPPPPTPAPAEIGDIEVEIPPPPAPAPADTGAVEAEIPAPPKSPLQQTVSQHPTVAEPSSEETADIDIDISLDDFAAPAEAAGPEARADKTPQAVADTQPIGIDLGTTYSCAAVVKDGKPEVIPSRKGHRTIPSIVAYSDNNRLLVGHSARAQMEMNPANTVYGSKRLTGRPYSSPAVQQMKDRFHYEIIEGPNNEAAVRIVGRNFSLQQIAAFILIEIQDMAREYLGTEVNRAVITVPAYFNENQRHAVREAGTLAGLFVERIVNEPTAAALAYGYNRSRDERLLVYDLGGGTFDVSVLEMTENVYEVIATGGDAFLGGVDFDNQLSDHLLYSFYLETGEAPNLSREATQRLRDAAERAKCELSEQEETTVKIPFFTEINGQPRDLEITVTRDTMEQLVGPLVHRTLEVSARVLAKANLRPNQIQADLLVGGQSRMPLIRHRIKEVFGQDPHKGVHPDEAVALGAALVAESAGKLDTVVLIDVLPSSIGIGLPSGRFVPVLEAGSSLPISKVHTFKNVRDNQDSLELLLFQGDGQLVVDNEYLGTLTISGITPAPKGSIQFEIYFALDQEGLFKVTALEKGTRKAYQAVLSTKDNDQSIRQKLNIPESTICTQTIGHPESLREQTEANPEQASADKSGGLLGKLFKKEK